MTRTSLLLILVSILTLAACGDGGKKRVSNSEGGTKTFGESQKEKVEDQKEAPKPTVSLEDAKIAAIEKQLETKFKRAKDPFDKAEIIGEMANLLGSKAKSVVPLVVAAAKAEDAELRAIALESLGTMDPSGSRPILEAAFKDGDESVRRAAVAGYAAAGIKDLGPLLRLYEGEFDGGVQMQIAQAIKVHGHGQPTGPVARLLESGTSMKAARLLIEFLEEEGASAEAERLVFFLSRDDPETRVAAAKALGTLGGKSKTIFAGLISSLTDDEISVRTQANESLKKLSGHDVDFDAADKESRLKDRAAAWSSWASENLK